MKKMFPIGLILFLGVIGVVRSCELSLSSDDTGSLFSSDFFVDTKRAFKGTEDIFLSHSIHALMSYKNKIFEDTQVTGSLINELPDSSGVLESLESHATLFSTPVPQHFHNIESEECDIQEPVKKFFKKNKIDKSSKYPKSKRNLFSSSSMLTGQHIFSSYARNKIDSLRTSINIIDDLKERKKCYNRLIYAMTYYYMAQTVTKYDGTDYGHCFLKNKPDGDLKYLTAAYVLRSSNQIGTYFRDYEQVFESMVEICYAIAHRVAYPLTIAQKKYCACHFHYKY